MSKLGCQRRWGPWTQPPTKAGRQVLAPGHRWDCGVYAAVTLVRGVRPWVQCLCGPSRALDDPVSLPWPVLHMVLV